MSRWVVHEGRLHLRETFDWSGVNVSTEPGTCPWCGGSGMKVESLDRDRLDVPVPCFNCQKYCPECKQYRPKGGHECSKQK